MCKGPKIDTTAQEQAQEDARRARLAEQERSREIRKGTRDINNLFDGGRYRVGTQEVTQRVERPEIERITQDARPEILNTFGRGDGNADITPAVPGTLFRVGTNDFDTIQEARDFRRGLPRTETVTEDVFARSEGIAPYLELREGALRDFYFPQLDQERDDASEGLGYALARSGLFNSSVANERRNDLDNEFALAGAKIESDIASDISSTKQRFEDQRNALLAELRATGDRSAAGEAGTRIIQNLSSDAPDLNPLPALFEGVTAGIGSAARGFNNGTLFRQLDTASTANSRGRIIGG